MKWCFLYPLLSILPFVAYSQTEAGLDLHSGFGMNTGTGFYLENDVETRATVSQLGLCLEFGLGPERRIEPETGLFLKYVRTTGEIGASHFTYSTLRMLIPAGVKFNFTSRWNGSVGCLIQNNRDFKDIFTHQSFNFRYDTFLQAAFQPSSLFSFSLRYQLALSNPNNPYLLNDPRHNFMVGLTCYLKSCKTK